MLSAVREEACRATPRSPRLYNPVSLTSPLRSYFSDVPSSPGLSCVSLPSAALGPSASQVPFQNPRLLPGQTFPEASGLSSPLSGPRRGELETAPHIMCYLSSCCHLSYWIRPPKERIRSNLASWGTKARMGGNLCQLRLYLLLIFLCFRTTESHGRSSLSCTLCIHRFMEAQSNGEPLGGLERVLYLGPVLCLATFLSFQGKATTPVSP